MLSFVHVGHHPGLLSRSDGLQCKNHENVEHVRLNTFTINRELSAFDCAEYKINSFVLFSNLTQIEYIYLEDHESKKPHEGLGL